MRTEIIVVLDRSGSMASIRNDVIGGFNTFLKAQQEVEGEAFITLVQFDTNASGASCCETLYEGKDLSKAKKLTQKDFVPRGGTPLFDALGQTIIKQGQRFDSASVKPERVILVIITDGEENSSREFTQEQIKKMISEQESKWGWQTTYIGANQDAFKVGLGLGVNSGMTMNYAAGQIGTRNAFKGVSNMVARSRGGASGQSLCYSLNELSDANKPDSK